VTRHGEAQGQGDAASPLALLEMISSSWMSQAIYVAARLGIADLLAEGPKKSDELARSVGAHADSLYRLMRGLATLGLCAERGDGVFEIEEGHVGLDALGLGEHLLARPRDREAGTTGQVSGALRHESGGY